MRRWTSRLPIRGASLIGGRRGALGLATTVPPPHFAFYRAFHCFEQLRQAIHAFGRSRITSFSAGPGQSLDAQPPWRQVARDAPRIDKAADDERHDADSYRAQ